MKSMNKKVSIWTALLACVFAGCESDVISNYTLDDPCLAEGTCPNPDEEHLDCLESCEIGSERCGNFDVMICQKDEKGCPEWVVKSQCPSGTHCDETTNACEEGCLEVCDGQPEKKCSEAGVVTCQTDSSGCAVWETIESCGEGTYCDPETLTCVNGCAEKCDPNALSKCTEEGIDSCESDENGCATHTLTPCESGTYCDEATVSCVECTETCKSDALKRCTENGVESCTADAHGCAVWSLTETCGEKQSCDSTAFKCIDGCKNACTAGEKKCDGNGVAECKDINGDGCFEWDKAVACPDGQTCDAGAKACQCSNTCTTEGEKKCENNSISTCTKSANGCLAWSKAESCGASKTCNSAKNACEYTCGNDCAPFSIILIPDTQNYARKPKGDSNTYSKQMKWIKDNEKKENIRAAIHLGDITDNNTTAQWEVADYAHKNFIDKSTVPYSISTGNHDYKGSGGYGRGRTQIDKYFGESRFKGKSWYHSSPYVGNSYITFAVGNIKFLVLALEFSARKDVICWADELLKKYPDHHVIVETHNYLTHNSSTDGSAYSGSAYLPDATNGASGGELYNELVARHSNVFMAVGGHVGDTEWRQKTAFNKNIVTEMLVDYQFDAPCDKSKPSLCTDHCKHVPNAGNGWLRQLIFDPKTNKVTAKTFTVLGDSSFAGNTKQFYCSSLNSGDRKWYNKDPKHSDHQFSFSCDFSTPIDYKYNNNNHLGFAIRTINSNGDGDQLNPAIAMHRTTGMMATVWEDDSSSADGKGKAGAKKDKNNHDIMGRIFYGGGCQKVKQFTVNADTAGDQMTPAVAMDKNGNFVVVWADDKDGNGAYEIFMRGFDENGKERIKTTVVNSKADGQQRNPSIAMAPDGRFVVAWEDESNGAKTPQIYIRGFDANGKQTFADRNVDNLEGVRRKPSVGMADDGTFVVTWEDDSDMNDWFQVQAKGFKADGTDRIKRFTVNSVADGQQLNPSISMNGAGVFFIAYEDDADKNGVYRIKARGYKADGSQLVADMHISDAGENAVQPVLCVDKNSNVVYSWTAKALNKGDIRRRVYKNKALAAKTYNANSIKEGYQDQPAVACTEGGKYAVLWHDDLDENGYYEIFGHGYNGM